MKSHFTYSDRVKLQYNLDNNYNLSASLLARILKKTRSSIYYEIKTNMVRYVGKDKFNPTEEGFICARLVKFPFTCNGCPNTRCSHRKYMYLAYEADKKARHSLISSRSDTLLKRNNIKIINQTISPLVLIGQSIYVAKNTSKCPLSESTIRRYVDKGIVEVKRHNLPKAVRFKAKKEYDYSSVVPSININALNGRTYADYKAYMDAHPNAKVIQVDSIIGKRNDKLAILTVYFVNSKVQLGFLYNRKHPNIPNILLGLYKIGKKYNETLFDVALGDNGTEFKNLYKLEVDDNTGEVYCKTFYTDPYRSCQKAECERNHGLFRRIKPKGYSFNLITQEEIDDIFSHINSYPRSSLNGKTPYELFSTEYNSIILTDLNIHQIPRTKVNLKNR